MGRAAILVIRPVPIEQIFNQPLPGSCIWNLIEIGPAVSEVKLSEKIDDTRDVDYAKDRWQITVQRI